MFNDGVLRKWRVKIFNCRIRTTEIDYFFSKSSTLLILVAGGSIEKF